MRDVFAYELRPGHVLAHYRHRGVIISVTCAGLTPWGDERLAVWFSDVFEPMRFGEFDLVTLAATEGA